MNFKFSTIIFLQIVTGTKCINSSQNNVDTLEIMYGFGVFILILIFFFSARCESLTSWNQRTHCQIKELKKIQLQKIILDTVGKGPRPKVNHINSQALLRTVKSTVEQKLQVDLQY